jgi:membrane protease YdiL (CAAX protease family)
VLIAPFTEEYLFRGLLFRALDREWGGWRAVVGSAAFFAIYHRHSPGFPWRSWAWPTHFYFVHLEHKSVALGNEIPVSAREYNTIFSSEAFVRGLVYSCTYA